MSGALHWHERSTLGAPAEASIPSRAGLTVPAFLRCTEQKLVRCHGAQTRAEKEPLPFEVP